MANYATLKTAIQNVIKTNGNNEITGALLQSSLLAIIDSLGTGYEYIGMATPTTNPGTPDQNVFYIASTAGTYTNFGSLVLALGEVAIIKGSGSTWTKETAGFATAEQINAVLAALGLCCVQLAQKFGSMAVVSGNGTDITGMSTGGYYNTSGQWVSNSNFKYQTIVVDPTKVYRIMCNNSSYTATMALALLDGNDEYMGGIQNLTTAQDFVFSGVSKIVISTAASNNNVSIKRFDNLMDIPTMYATLNAVEKKLDGLFDWGAIPIRNIQDIIIGGNQFKNAKLVKSGAYVSSVNANLTPIYTNNASFNTYLIPVDGTNTYLFTFARFLLMMQDQEHAISGGSVQSNITSISSVGANYILFSFNTTSYPESSYQVGIGQLQQNPEYEIPYLVVKTGNIKDAAITTPKIKDKAVTLEKVAFAGIGKNKFNVNDPDCVLSAFLSNNTLTTSGSTAQSYNVTGYIPVEPGQQYQCSNDGDRMVGTYLGRFVCQYDANKNYISGADITVSTDTNNFTVGANTHFVRISVRKPNWEKYQVEKGIVVTSWERFGYFINTENLSIPTIAAETFGINSAFKGFSGAGTLANGESFTLPQSYCRKNVAFVALITGANDAGLDILFGLGKNKYNGGWLELTPTKLIVHKYESSDVTTEYTHGLTLGPDATVIFNAGTGNATITLISAGEIFTQQIDRGFYFGGAGFAENAGTQCTVQLNVYPKDITQKIWMFGDSYLGWINPYRWPYWLLQWSFNKWMADARPGGNSPEGFVSFINDLRISKPVYLLWANGMNDAADANTTTPNPIWLNNVQEVINKCEELGIIPILATIPSVPSKLHDGKNAWVRNSGYRYIDFAVAVGASSSGVWYDGMLSGDNVHPTEKGAKALAARAVADFPELMND